MLKSTKLSRNLAKLMLVAVLFTSCQLTTGYYIEQEVRESEHSYDVNFVTYVWHRGKIIKAWYDPIDSVNTNIVTKRKIQADSLVSALKNSY